MRAEKCINEDEANLCYLQKYKFAKTIKSLTKKLKGKRVVVYGNGSLFKLMLNNYDFSGLNIVGVADKKFEDCCCDKSLSGYDIKKLGEINSSEVDYILVSLKFYVPVLLSLYDRFKDTSIKVKPLVHKPIITLISELLRRK